MIEIAIGIILAVFILFNWRLIMSLTGIVLVYAMGLSVVLLFIAMIGIAIRG